jgi:hypothetical protein
MFFKGNKDSLKDANADKSNLADQADALLESPVRMEGMAGAPIAAGAPGEAGAPIRAITQSGAWSLGQTSKRFESGSGGAGTISSGAGDLGGVSYGIYQFSSKTGGVQEFLKNTPYGKEFEGLVPATDAFNAKWKELAKDPAFGQAQHDFIKGQYYDVQMRRLKQAGFDFSDRGPAVQDNIWSTAVQMRGLTLKVVQGALAGQDWQKWTDAQIVAAIQDYKYANTEKLFSKSPTLWGGLRKRAESEKASLVQLANNTQYPQGATSSLPDAQVAMQNGATTQPNGKPNNGTASAPGQRMANGNVVASKDGSNGNTVIRGPQGVLIAVNA